MGLLQDMLKEVPLSSVLKERVALAEQKYERAGEEIEGLKRRIAHLERENQDLRAQVPTGSKRPIAADTTRVLVHLFRATEDQDRAVATMARKLSMERGVLQYHLDRLQDVSFAVMASVYDGDTYWAITAAGRKQVVEAS